MIENKYQKFYWIIAGICLLLIFLCSNYRLIFGMAAPIWDAGKQFEPYYTLIADFTRSGKLLTWNPWMNSGSPDFIEMQMGALSPVTLLMGLLTGGNVNGFVLYWLFIWFMGGLGFLLLLKHLNIPVLGAFICALGYLFSGFYTGHAQHTSHIYSISFLPWIIWRFDLAIKKSRNLYAVQSGALLGLSALAGYPAITLLTGCFCIFWAAGRCLEFVIKKKQNSLDTFIRGSSISVFSAFSKYVLILAFISLLIASPSYVGFCIEGPGFTHRSVELPKEQSSTINAFSPRLLSSFTSPYIPILNIQFYLEPGQMRWDKNTSCAGIYCSVIVFVLFVFSLIVYPIKTWRWILFFTGFLYLICAMSQDFPLRGWLYDLIFIFRYFKQSAIFSYYTIFIIALLGSYGASDLINAIKLRDSRTLRRFSFVALCSTFFAVNLYAVIFFRYSVDYSFRYPNIHFVSMWTSICIAAFFFLFSNLKKKILYSGFLLLLAFSVFDAFFTYFISSSMMVYSGGNLEKRSKLNLRHVSSIDLNDKGLERLDQHFGENPLNVGRNLLLKKPIIKSYLPLKNSIYDSMIKNPVLKSMAMGKDRFFFSSETVCVSPSYPNLKALGVRCRMLNRPCFIITNPDLMENLFKRDLSQSEQSDIEKISGLKPAVPIQFDLISYKPDEIVFNYNCVTDGWLLVTDRWSKSWRASVNGNNVRVWGGNFVFRAIPVKKGLCRIEFHFKPVYLIWLICLSWGTLLLILCISLKR